MKDGKFEVGDRVRIIQSAIDPNEMLVGEEGVIVYIFTSIPAEYGLDMDKDIGGHACLFKGAFRARPGHGRCYPAACLELIPQPAAVSGDRADLLGLADIRISKKALHEIAVNSCPYPPAEKICGNCAAYQSFQAGKSDRCNHCKERDLWMVSDNPPAETARPLRRFRVDLVIETIDNPIELKESMDKKFDDLGNETGLRSVTLVEMREMLL